MSHSFIQQFTILAPPFLLAITFHEFCHGYVAWLFGDPTAYRQGRLTMNPLKHLDLLGVLAFIIMKIGWAKPVPVNATYFKNPVRDMMWVSFAGPGANLLLALASALLVKLLLLAAPLIPSSISWPLGQMMAASIWINLMLAFFNLIPIPPLDGSRIITGLLPPEAAVFFQKLEPFGFIILLILFYLGIIPRLILPMINLAHGLLTS
ncbi:MAG: site-2 protease family protein [Proteobacteria bacterium]|nr:site-2 protease family protein [Pseudomonadota bacterium]MBU1689018.1 site-2 protease family protein [Pseudomonadota bacterium]